MSWTMRIVVNDQIHLSEIQPSDKAACVEHFREKEIYDRTLRIPYPYTEKDFDEFMADDLAMVRRIHAVAGLPDSRAAEASMRAFTQAHPRGRFGGIDYDLAPFGLDRNVLSETFAFYAERFGVRAEG